MNKDDFSRGRRARNVFLMTGDALSRSETSLRKSAALSERRSPWSRALVKGCRLLAPRLRLPTRSHLSRRRRLCFRQLARSKNISPSIAAQDVIVERRAEVR